MTVAVNALTVLPLLATEGLTAGGWIMMLASVGGMTAFLIWCVYKVVSTPEATEHVHSQADIEPPDVRTR